MDIKPKSLLFDADYLHDISLVSTFQGKSYHFGTVARVNWHRASDYCRLNGMQLLNLPSYEENRFIEDQLIEIGEYRVDQ